MLLKAHIKKRLFVFRREFCNVFIFTSFLMFFSKSNLWIYGTVFWGMLTHLLLKDTFHLLLEIIGIWMCLESKIDRLTL